MRARGRAEVGACQHHLLRGHPTNTPQPHCMALRTPDLIGAKANCFQEQTQALLWLPTHMPACLSAYQPKRLLRGRRRSTLKKHRSKKAWPS